MATQFYEISEALQSVHNDRAPTLSYLEDRDSNKELYGRHGDIKPGKLLHLLSSSAFPLLIWSRELPLVPDDEFSRIAGFV